MTFLAIVIPHYEDLPRLVRALSALRPQVAALMSEGRSVDVVVVDNASQTDLAPARAAWPELRLVVEPEKGAANARNRGIAETNASIVAFLDSDCVPDSDWLDRLWHHGKTLAAMSAQMGPHLIGGKVSVFDETPAPRSGAEAFETVFAFDNEAYVERKGFSVTANLVTTREVLEHVGPMHHGLSEDLDWCHRAKAAGCVLTYAPDLCVSHPTRADWPALKRKWQRLTSESYGLTSGTIGARLKWALRALAMLPSIFVHAPRILSHPQLSRLEKARALKTLAHLRLARCVWMLGQATAHRS